MQSMSSPTTLQRFLRLAQASLALNDKYAQRVIIQDDKSQLTFRSLDEFKADDVERMHVTPSVKFSQMVSLERAIDLANKLLAEEVKTLRLKADVDLA
jgi:hypothetical protein